MSFQFDYTKNYTEALLWGNTDWQEWHEYIVDLLPYWNIDTAPRVAGFIAQCSHESNNFRVLEENLNYSAAALEKIFTRHFSGSGRNAEDFHRQPEAIANVIYANRMANGAPESGDGWRFRGRGVIQLTGRHNYTQFARSIGKSLDETVEYLKTKKGALESACWFWNTNNLNSFADRFDIEGMSRRINGGTIGLDHRKELYQAACDILGVDPASAPLETVKNGSRGRTVRLVQEALGLTADGIFGPNTEQHVKNFQISNGLVADGIAGPQTLEVLLA